MKYTKHSFKSGGILYASDLNEMDAQIVLNAENIDNLQVSIDDKQPLGDYALKDEIPTIPVESVNGKTGSSYKFAVTF